MNTGDVGKTTKIANLQILVEQVIRWLKCFRVLANGMTINELQYVDDMLKVLTSMPNLKKTNVQRLDF